MKTVIAFAILMLLVLAAIVKNHSNKRAIFTDIFNQLDSLRARVDSLEKKEDSE